MEDAPAPDSSILPPPFPEAEAPPPKLPPSRLERVLAAVQAATLSAFLTSFWCGIAARSSDHSFWTVPNLMSGLVYGPHSLRPDFGYHTLVGLAIHLLASTLFAVLFALAIPPNLRLFTSLLLGILAATSWFYLVDGFFWRRAFPPVALYSRRPSIFFSFVLMGICVGLYSVFVRSSKETQLAA